MKVGDLVTLSAYGLKMAPMWNWQREARSGKPAIGIVVAIQEHPYAYSWTSKNEKHRYYIEWCGDGPASRDDGASVRSRVRGSYFLRNDLRFVK